MGSRMLYSAFAYKPMKCQPCDLWSSSYDLWVAHLTSESHQDKVASRTGNIYSHEYWREDSIRNSCLILSGVKQLGIAQIIGYLSKWGIVEDIIRQQDKNRTLIDHYFVRYESEESVNKILAAQSRIPHQVQGQQIFFRRKYERAAPITNRGYNAARNSLPQIHNQYQHGHSEPSSAAVRRSEPILYRGKGHQGALGAVASEYRDHSESALVVLQSTYDDDESDKEENEQHDLFSPKMMEHLAISLSSSKIEDQLEGFCSNVLLSEPYLQDRFKMIQELLGMLKNRYPKTAIYPCGPDYIGIGNGDDAVNVVIDLFDNTLTKRQPWEQSSEDQLSEIHKILRQHQGSFCSNLSKIDTLITFTHMGSRVNCKLRTNSNYPLVQESMLIKFLCTLDPRVRPLLILTRYWGSFHKILETPEYDTRNRLLILLMIFHLTNRKVIPSLSHLQSLEHPKMILENVDISFCGDCQKVPKNQNKMLQDSSIKTLSVLSLLKDFFQRFAVANFKNNTVCLWPGLFIEKAHLLNPRNEHLLPEELAKKLRFKADGSIIMNRVDTSTPICICDFFDVTKSLTSKVAEAELKHFQLTCWKSFQKLEELLNLDKPYIMDLFVDTAKLIAAADNNIVKTEQPEEVEIIEIDDEEKSKQFSVEWEAFSRTIEPVVTKTKPVAPVAPSPKSRWAPAAPNSSQMYRPPSYAGPNPVQNPAYSSAQVNRPPMHYNQPRNNYSSSSGSSNGTNQQRGGTEQSASHYVYPSYTTSDEPRRMSMPAESSSSSSTSSSSGGSDEDEILNYEKIRTTSTTLTGGDQRIEMPKLTIPRWTVTLFTRAVESKEFAYGIHGKIQSLYLQFLIDFNSRFWSTCFGFDVQYDPPCQNITPADYARLDKEMPLEQKLNAVPIYEDSYSVSFYCRNLNVTNAVLVESKNGELMSAKFIGNHVKTFVEVLLNQKQSNRIQPMRTQETLRFKGHFTVTLDYDELTTSSCHPSGRIVLENAGSTFPRHNLLIRFLGRCFNKACLKFTDHCFKNWLSMSEIDLADIERRMDKEKCEANRLENMERIAKGQKKLSKKQRRKISSRNIQQQKQKKFQVPTSWNKSIY